jgi:hypothetical protein
MSDNILINGPINVCRLEGTVFGIKKILYVYMDIHADVAFQTQCPSFLSTDLSTHLAHNIQQSTKVLDFFMEVRSSYLSVDEPKYRGRYIDEVVRLFKQEERTDPKSGKRQTAKSNSKVRVHYIDIRDFIKDHINIILHNISKIINATASDNTAYLDELESVLQYLEHLETDIMEFYMLFFDKENTKMVGGNKLSGLESRYDLHDNDNRENILHSIKYHINKLKTKYKHIEVFERMGKFIFYIQQQFEKIIDTIVKIKKEINILSKKIDKPYEARTLVSAYDLKMYTYGQNQLDNISSISELSKLTYILRELITSAYARIVDIFFLRRFLDKDYITSAIVYTGAAHSILYVHHLVNEYDFKVTHFSIAHAKTPEELTEKIKKYPSYNDIYKIEELLWPIELIQCSDMSSFPLNFS